jgi:uncharacterized protein (TIGR02266 family)
MAEERRSNPRARISGARVNYESATGEGTEADALNLGRGGLFVRAAKPLPVGKRLALEIEVAGELVPWSALGRVVWVRQETEGERRPSGMGIKLIDVEDAVVATIERLVAERVHAEPGIGEVDPGRHAAATPNLALGPTRERTILGVGSGGRPGPMAPPDLGGAPARDVTPAPAAPAREASLAIDLVDSEKRGTPSAHRERRDQMQPESYARPASRTPPPAKQGAGRWGVVLIVLAVAAVAAYVLLGGNLGAFLKQ